MHEQESLSGRIERFVGLVGAIFAVTIAVLVTQRLSRDALAMLIGLACGIGAITPTALLGLWLWQREMKRAARQAQEQALVLQRAAQVPAPQSPPVVVIAPPGMGAPGYGYGQRSLENPYAAWGQPSSAERRFTIVGGEE